MLRKEYVRKGIYGGRLCTFTDWNPKNNMVWCDDIPAGKDPVTGRLLYGAWIPSDKVKWQ